MWIQTGSPHALNTTNYFQEAPGEFACLRFSSKAFWASVHRQIAQRDVRRLRCTHPASLGSLYPKRIPERWDVVWTVFSLHLYRIIKHLWAFFNNSETRQLRETGLALSATCFWFRLIKQACSYMKIWQLLSFHEAPKVQNEGFSSSFLGWRFLLEFISLYLLTYFSQTERNSSWVLQKSPATCGSP